VQVQGQVQIQGWFSPQAKVYMNDVIDHLEVRQYSETR
jgi:hypothetical protein